MLLHIQNLSKELINESQDMSPTHSSGVHLPGKMSKRMGHLVAETVYITKQKVNKTTFETENFLY